MGLSLTAPALGEGEEETHREALGEEEEEVHREALRVRESVAEVQGLCDIVGV